MVRSLIRSQAIFLLAVVSNLSPFLQYVDASLLRRHDSGIELAPSHWHTKRLAAPDMTLAQAMEHYFPRMKREFHTGSGNETNNDDGCAEEGGSGSSHGGSNATQMTGNWSIRNYNTVASVYNLTVYPKNLPLFLNQTGIGLPFFDENVTGRVTPLGNFTGYEDNVEYFWGLAPVPIDPSTAAITTATVTHFTSGCPEVAASTVELRVINYNGPNAGSYISTIKQIAFWRFGSDGRIIAYDAWIPNLSDFVAKVTRQNITVYPGGSYTPSEVDKATTIAQICAAQNQFCVGANQVYANFADCQAQLAAKPYGDYDETWGDNVVCRRVHVLLVPVRPGVHCAHVGPTGGSKCVDVNANEVYFDNTQLFGSDNTFRCPGDLGGYI